MDEVEWATEAELRAQARPTFTSNLLSELRRFKGSLTQEDRDFGEADAGRPPPRDGSVVRTTAARKTPGQPVAER